MHHRLPLAAATLAMGLLLSVPTRAQEVELSRDWSKPAAWNNLSEATWKGLSPPERTKAWSLWREIQMRRMKAGVYPEAYDPTTKWIKDRRAYDALLEPPIVRPEDEMLRDAADHLLRRGPRGFGGIRMGSGENPRPADPPRPSLGLGTGKGGETTPGATTPDWNDPANWGDLGKQTPPAEPAENGRPLSTYNFRGTPGGQTTRVGDDGTETLTGGASGLTGHGLDPKTNQSFRAGQGAGESRLPGAGAPRKDPVRIEDPKHRAGLDREAGTGYDPRTRWKVVKDWIRKVLESYVNGDLSGMLGAFSRNFLQDYTILRQAIQEDFRNQTNINVDIELLEYRMTRDTVIVRIRWNRTAVDQDVGQPVVQTGVSRLLFDRHDGLRLTGWFLTSPFGFFTQAWQAQVAAGDPNGTSGSGSSGGFFSGSGSVPLTYTGSVGDQNGFIVELDQDNGGTAIGTDTGATFEGLLASGLPTGDFVLQTASLAAFNFGEVYTPNNISPGNFPIAVARLEVCPGASQVSDVRDVIPGNINGLFNIISPLSPGPPVARVYAFKTQDGRFGVIRLAITNAGGFVGTHSVSYAYRTAKTPGDAVIDPSGSVTCP